MTRISVVLFDLDGVLVDATEWHYEALNRALRLFGFDISRYEHLSAYNGLPTRKKLRHAERRERAAGRHPQMLNRLKQVYTRDEISHQVPAGLREGVHAESAPPRRIPAGGAARTRSATPSS